MFAAMPLIPSCTFQLDSRRRTGARSSVQSRFLDIGELGDVLEVELQLPAGEYRLASSGEDFDSLILDAVEQGFTTRQQIQDAIEDMGGDTLTESVATKRLKALLDDGRIQRTGRGKATRYTMPEGSADETQ